MKIVDVDLDERVFVIAEIGNNHEGDFGMARELIAGAAEAGVDAVKFQTCVPEHFVGPQDAARLERLRRFQLSRDQYVALAEHAKKLSVVFFSTPLDLESARFLNTLQPLFKIASGDNTFHPLIEAVAGFSKPLIISTGLADIELLERLRADVQRVWGGSSPGLAFLHCVTSYPVPAEQANLGAIATLKQRFMDCAIGYSDHTLGTAAASYAVAAGAQIIEKHFTLDKQYSDFRDHYLSADPPEMTRLVKEIRTLKTMMGTGRKVPQPCERDFMVAIRRSVAAARDLPLGTKLSAADFAWVRPGTGIAPGDERRLIGSTTRRDLRQGEIIQDVDVAAP